MRNDSLMQALKIARQALGRKDPDKPPAPPRLAVEIARKTMPEAALLRANGGRLLQDAAPSHYMPGVGRQVMAAGGEPDPAAVPDAGVVQTPETPPAAPQKAYVDPPTQYLTDWNWRGLPDVQAALGNLKEIPSHVKAFGSFMNDTANRAGTSGLTPRDLIKAYTITRASIQRRAVDHQRLRDSGLILPNDVTGYVRPEGAFGHWLHTDMGKKYLSGAVKGVVNQDAVANAVQVMAPFGKHEKDIPDALIWAAKNLPGREQEISRLVAQAQQGQSEPSEWRAFTKDVRGIGPSKSGFVASLMGRGDQPTLDARQVILHTGRPTKEAQKYIARSGGKGGEEAVDRLAARQRALNLGGAEGLEPYYQHLTHHAVWDKASNEETTHEDVINAMRHAADGGAINGEQDLSSHPVAQGLAAAGAPGIPQTQPQAGAQPKELNPVQYQSWDDVPTINPQDLVGKKVFPIFADLTKAGSAFSGIDSSKLDQPEQLYGGPGYPLLPESQQHGLAWAVEGKGRGTSKLLKDADYIAVSAMEPFSHQSNASFSNALMKNMAAYVRDQRLTPDGLSQINQMIQTPSAQKELQGMEAFPGFEHPDAESFLRNMTFEQRKRVSQVLSSKEAQDLGAPNIEKITQSTLDPQFAGVPSRHAMFLMKIPKTKTGELDDAELNKLLVHLKTEGLPEHPSYQYGIRGNLVGKFHYPVAPEVLFKDWFDKKQAEAATKVTKTGRTNLRRAFDLEMPVGTITQEIADRLPRHPRDIQSGKAAQLALNAFNDQWSVTGTPIGKGGLSPTALSTALKNSESSSTLSQYTPQALQDMIKDKKFTGYKLKGGEVYFGLKRGTDYADDYGFQHPELGPNETSLVSVVNNEPGARGIGGAPVVLKAIQHGATALDCYAVPTKKHPNGFLPTFYSDFGFEELGRVPFDPQYVSPRQLEDMKHEWTKSGWDESMGMPALSIMKWKGNENDREGAIRSHILKGSESAGVGRDTSDVEAADRVLEQGAGPDTGAPQGERGDGDAGGDRGGIRNGRPPRPADRFTRTLAEIKKLSHDEMRHFGVNPEDVELAKSRGLKSGGAVGYAGGGYVTRQDGPYYRVHQADDRGSGSAPEGARREIRQAPAVERGGSGPAEYGSAELPPNEGPSGLTEARNPLEMAQQHVRDVHGREFEPPKMPESSLAKQSAIGRVYSEAVGGSPEYKNAIFSAYAQQMPAVIEQSGAQNYDDLLRKSYEQMAKETDDQFRLLKGYQLSFHKNGEGNYPTSKHMVDDVNNNKHLFVYQGGDKHDFLHNEDPETGLNENEKFRAVHDLFGHAILGNQFGPKGEETAWGVHQQMYSPLARLAMTAETRGQNSFVNYTPINAELKEKLNDLDERIVADRRAYRDTSMLEDRKKKMFEGFQFAPNKAVLLPPEFLSTEYNGGMPSYMKDIIRPAEGTGMSSKLTHFSNEPGLTETDPSRYGTGIKGDEASRLRSVPGAVKERSYFYLGEPGSVTPEEGLGQHRYEATAENLYNLAEDPLKFKTLAREANRRPWSSNFNPGTVDPNRFSNDLERLAKEHGYSGVANPNAAFPMAAMFDPTPVTPRADGGKVNSFIPHDDPRRNENLSAFLAGNHPDVPHVVHHGSDRDILAFDPEKAKSEGNAFFFSKDWGVRPTEAGARNAGTYAPSRGGSIYPVHLSMKNPHIVGFTEPMPSGDATQDEWDEYLARHQKFDDQFNDDRFKERYFRKAMETAKYNGNDGVIFKGITDDRIHNDIWSFPSDIFAVFNPSQIKSAIGNNGNFDASEQDINKAKGGAIQTKSVDVSQSRIDRAEGGEINAGDIPSIDNPISVFPKPQRMYSDEDRVPGGQYLDAKTKADLTGKKAAMASIGINPGGKPYFNASPNDVDETGSPGRGSAITKANLFKQKAGWKWVQAPDGHEDTSTVVSVAHRGDHHYALNAHFPKGVDFARYENASSEPRLRPTTRGNIIKGDQVGSISVRGKEHPVYDHIIVKASGGAVDSKYNSLANHGNSKSIVDKALMLTSRKA